MRASRVLRHVARLSYGRATLAAGTLVAGGLVVHQLQIPAHCKKGFGHTSIYAWGGGMSGALGTGGTANSPAPSCVDALPGDPTQVACGDGFSACVTAAGELYTWGQGRDGRLGHGDSSDSIYPRKVECEGVVSVGLGHCHAIAVTRAGGVLAWGRGFAGQLGLGDGKSHWKPERLDLSGVTPPLDDVRVVAAACGGSHSALLLASGEVPPVPSPPKHSTLSTRN
ncbi:regulator of chromosome condensation 1/beta-lactamase-inhibitor protein II [Baffinella frigidus]|nr:regulator of chromosome condensation 1/beta-lactamase-inhibitor protein II [Cryptophyta sp. CCMP2293]